MNVWYNRFNDTYRDYPEDETLIDLWQRSMARVSSDAVAVRCGGQTMTYAALDARSSAMALHLKRRAFVPEMSWGCCASGRWTTRYRY